MRLLKLGDNIEIINTKLTYSIDEATEHFKEVIAAGGEGTIIKNPSGFWKDGLSKDQVKMKSEKECELKIVGKTEGLGKFEGTLGALICQSDDEALTVNVSGFTDHQRDMIYNNWDEWIGGIITVRFNEVIDNKKSLGFSLFLPRYIERRYDKTEADSIDHILYL